MIEYRSDIDGLRAFAVLLVVFFHLDVGVISGGFIGVDIFFTISGFLISSIIFKSYAKNKFSFKEFYIRRATRLIPAYLTVLISTLLAGMYILPPNALSELINSAIASTLFFSNIYFMLMQSGYFSAATHEFPLLHTWSLSVEEQFYLVMPLCLILLLKIQRVKIKLTILVLLTIFSFFVSFLLTEINSKVAYYLIISRAGEFLVGVTLAYFIHCYGVKFKLNKTLSNSLFVMSLLVIMLSATLIDSSDKFPGLLAIAPCLATIGIIMAGLNKQCISRVLFGNRHVVFVGLISYSLYLWHWPIIAYLKVLGIDFTPLVQGIVFLLSIFLAYCTWALIENKTRHNRHIQNGKGAITLYVLPCVLLTAFLLIAQSAKFYPERFSHEIIIAESALHSKPELGRKNCLTKNLTIDSSYRCLLGAQNSDDFDMVLWGDSHANHFAGFVDQVAGHYGQTVLEVTRGNCPPLIGLYINAKNAKNGCIERNDKVLQFLKSSNINGVILAGAWGGYTMGSVVEGDTVAQRTVKLGRALEHTLDVLLYEDISPVVFEMLPRQKIDKSNCYLKVISGRTNQQLDDCTLLSTSARFTELSKLFNRLKLKYKNDVKFVSLETLYCKDGVCPNYVDGVPLYRDTNHLNLDGSIKLGQLYLKNEGSL